MHSINRLFTDSFFRFLFWFVIILTASFLLIVFLNTFYGDAVDSISIDADVIFNTAFLQY